MRSNTNPKSLVSVQKCQHKSLLYILVLHLYRPFCALSNTAGMIFILKPPQDSGRKLENWIYWPPLLGSNHRRYAFSGPISRSLVTIILQVAIIHHQLIGIHLGLRRFSLKRRVKRGHMLVRFLLKTVSRMKTPSSLFPPCRSNHCLKWRR